MVSLNFAGADLVEVIHVLAQYLKLNYTIDPAVRRKVTLYRAQPLRQEDLLPVFHQDTEKKRTGTTCKMCPCSPNRRGGRTSPFPVVGITKKIKLAARVNGEVPLIEAIIKIISFKLLRSPLNVRAAPEDTTKGIKPARR